MCEELAEHVTAPEINRTGASVLIDVRVIIFQVASHFRPNPETEVEVLFRAFSDEVGFEREGMKSS